MNVKYDFLSITKYGWNKNLNSLCNLTNNNRFQNLILICRTPFLTDDISELMEFKNNWMAWLSTLWVGKTLARTI